MKNLRNVQIIPSKLLTTTKKGYRLSLSLKYARGATPWHHYQFHSLKLLTLLCCYVAMLLIALLHLSYDNMLF